MPDWLMPLLMVLAGAGVPWFLKAQEEKAKEEKRKAEERTAEEKKKAEERMASVEARIKELEENAHECDKDRAKQRLNYENLEKRFDSQDEKLDKILAALARRTLP